jgi:hypothetical protein
MTASSGYNCPDIQDKKLGRTDAVLFQVVTQPFNASYAVIKYPFFARILAVCRARASTIPTIHSASLQASSCYNCPDIQNK